MNDDDSMINYVLLSFLEMILNILTFDPVRRVYMETKRGPGTDGNTPKGRWAGVECIIDHHFKGAIC